MAAGVGVGFSSLNADALTPRHLRLVPLDQGVAVTTSLIWESANETPALRRVITTEDDHLVPPNAGRP